MDAGREQLFNKALSVVCKRRKLEDPPAGSRERERERERGRDEDKDGERHCKGVDKDVSLGQEINKVLGTYRLSAVERQLLQWHIANLEYGCGAPLSQVSCRYCDFGFGVLGVGGFGVWGWGLGVGV
jgi:hypothetical protein